MSRKEPRRRSRCSDGSRTTTNPASRAIAKASGLRPWTNSAPSSSGTGHPRGLRVQTRPPIRPRASSTSTRAPASHSSAAAARPEAPPPTTTKSRAFIRPFFWGAPLAERASDLRRGYLPRRRPKKSDTRCRIPRARFESDRSVRARNASCIPEWRASRPTRRSRSRPRPVTKGSFSMARARGEGSKSGNGGQGVNRAGSSRRTQGGTGGRSGNGGARTSNPDRKTKKK